MVVAKSATNRARRLAAVLQVLAIVLALGPFGIADAALWLTGTVLLASVLSVPYSRWLSALRSSRPAPTTDRSLVSSLPDPPAEVEAFLLPTVVDTPGQVSGDRIRQMVDVQIEPSVLRLIDGCGDPAFVVDGGYTVVHWNAAAAENLGIPTAQALGRTCYDLIAGKSASGRELCHANCEKWALARRGARIHNFEMCAVPEQDIWLNVSILPISDAEERVVALAHVARNVNHAKRLEHYVRDLANSAADVVGEVNGKSPAAEPPPTHLTARELEVLRLLAHGMDTLGIADALAISRHTARNHVAAVLNKLGAHSRVEAAAYAFRHKLD